MGNEAFLFSEYRVFKFYQVKRVMEMDDCIGKFYVYFTTTKNF